MSNVPEPGPLPGGGWNVTAVQVGGDSYDASPNDFVPMDGTDGNVTVTLPDATTCKNKLVGVKDAVGGNVSSGLKVTTVDGQLIDNQSTGFGLTLSAISGGNNFASAVFISDGSNWFIAYAYVGQPPV